LSLSRAEITLAWLDGREEPIDDALLVYMDDLLGPVDDVVVEVDDLLGPVDDVVVEVEDLLVLGSIFLLGGVDGVLAIGFR